MCWVTLRSALRFPPCFWICMVNVLAEPQVEELALLLILFYIWPPLQCDIHFHTQVAQDKAHGDGGLPAECHYIYDSLFVCIFWGRRGNERGVRRDGIEQITSNGTRGSVSTSTSLAIMTQKGLIPAYPWPWFKFSSKSRNAFWGWTQIKLLRCVCVCVWKCKCVCPCWFCSGPLWKACVSLSSGNELVLLPWQILY